jgi:hypothetical protein
VAAELEVADSLVEAREAGRRVLEEAAGEHARQEAAGPGAAARVRVWLAAPGAGKIAAALAALAVAAGDDLAQVRVRSRGCAELAREPPVWLNRDVLAGRVAVRAPAWQVRGAGLPGVAGIADELALVDARTRVPAGFARERPVLRTRDGRAEPAPVDARTRGLVGLEQAGLEQADPADAGIRRCDSVLPLAERA